MAICRCGTRSIVAYKQLWALLKCEFIIKVLDRSVSFSVLEQKVKHLCNLSFECTVIDLEHGYAFSRDNFCHVINKSSWVVMGHHVIVTP